MFLRIKVREIDQETQRFLWRGKVRNKESMHFEMTSLIFDAKSSPCSAMFIKNNNAKEYEDTWSEETKSIMKNGYMDDFLAG
jgi:hypothetical protein